MAVIKATCPVCGQKAEQSWDGMKLYCPYCKQKFTVERDDSVSKSKLLPEEGTPDTAGQYQPCTGSWSRAIARWLDIMLGAVVLEVVGICLNAEPPFDSLFDALNVFLIGPFMLEWLFYAIFKCTPGKFLFGIRIINQNGEKLTPAEYWKRIISVWREGFFWGIPLLWLIRADRQLHRFRENMQASYDEKAGFFAVKVKRSTLMNTVLCSVGILLFCIIILLNVVAKVNEINLRNKAEKGDSAAKFELACQYLEDFSRKHEGFALLKKSAEAGYAPAQAELAARYMLGMDTAKDIPAGIRWATKAAEQRVPEAYQILSNYYGGEFGDEYINYEKFFEYSQKSANAGLAAGKFNLGICYYAGYGCKQDQNRGLRLLKEAARLDCQEAKEFLRELNISW